MTTQQAIQRSASLIVDFIEYGQIENAGSEAQQLVHFLGGNRQLHEMTPGAAALYLLMLIESKRGIL